MTIFSPSISCILTHLLQSVERLIFRQARERIAIATHSNRRKWIFRPVPPSIYWKSAQIGLKFCPDKSEASGGAFLLVAKIQVLRCRAQLQTPSNLSSLALARRLQAGLQSIAGWVFFLPKHLFIVIEKADLQRQRGTKIPDPDPDGSNGQS